MNEMRASAVTRQTLTEFYQLQSNQMQMYVQSKTAPLHGVSRQLMQSAGQLQTRAASGNAEARLKPHDPARRRVAFIGVGAGTIAGKRIAAMDRFMKAIFADLRLIGINVFPE